MSVPDNIPPSRVFAIVPKQTSNPFYEIVRSGCESEAAKLGVVCEFVGPVQQDAYLQLAIVQELISRPVQGIAIAAIDQTISTLVINLAIDAGIPVITFDSDAPHSRRLAYVGTNNYAFGGALAKVLHQLRPKGGKCGLVATSAPNILLRSAGFRSYLKGTSWFEVKESPTDCMDNTEIALEQMYDLASLGNDEIDAVVAMGGWPMFSPNSTDWRYFVDANRNLELVVADTISIQIDLLSKNYVDGLVGQVPYLMGVQAIELLSRYPKANKNVEVLHGTAFLEMVRYPLVLPDLAIDQNLVGNLRCIGFAAFGITVAVSLFFSLWTWRMRKNQVVRASQPAFLGMLAVGTIITSSSIIPLSFDDANLTTASEHHLQLICMSPAWLVSLGFTVTFSALFSKSKYMH
jgi:ABC-type sugar transport system substrate-binding protein